MLIFTCFPHAGGRYSKPHYSDIYGEIVLDHYIDNLLLHGIETIFVGDINLREYLHQSHRS